MRNLDMFLAQFKHKDSKANPLFNLAEATGQARGVSLNNLFCCFLKFNSLCGSVKWISMRKHTAINSMKEVACVLNNTNPTSMDDIGKATGLPDDEVEKVIHMLVLKG
jgi:hypothetical protein